MLSIKKIMKNTKIIISTLVIVITIFATFQSNILAQVAGNQFDSHPMHWARYWARAVFDRNLIYAEGWNLGTIEGTRWPGSEGLGAWAFSSATSSTATTSSRATPPPPTRTA